MALVKSPGYGTKIFYDDNEYDPETWDEDGADWVQIGGVKDSIEGDTTFDTADLQTLDDFFTQPVVVGGDSGDITYEMALHNGEESNDAIDAIALSGALKAYKVEFPQAGSPPDIFVASIVGRSRMASRKELLVKKIVLKIHGEPGWSAGSGS